MLSTSSRNYGSIYTYPHLTPLSIDYTSRKHHQLQQKRLKEVLQIAVTNVGYNREQLQHIIDNLSNYSTLFFILCKRRYYEDYSEETNKKEFLIALIEFYLKNTKLIDLRKLNNEDILNNISINTLKDAVLSIKGYELLKEPSLVYNYLLLIHLLHFDFYRDDPNTLPNESNTLYFYLLLFLLQAYVRHIGDKYDKFDLELYKDENIISELINYKAKQVSQQSQTLRELSLLNSNKISDYQRDLLKDKVINFFRPAKGFSSTVIEVFLEQLLRLSPEDIRYLVSIEGIALKSLSIHKEPTTDEQPLELVVLDSSKKSKTALLKADQIEVLPQFGGTCWFNAILMVMLYSQGLRNFIYEKALEWQSEDPEELKRNKFKRFLMYILKYNYTQPRKIKELFQKRVNAELLLLSYLEYYHSKDVFIYDVENLKMRLKKYDYGFFQEFISNIFESLFKNYEDYLNLSFIEGKLYLNITKDQHRTVPRVLFLYHDSFFQIKPIDGLLPTTIQHDGISEYKKEVTFNGYKYKLDACCFVNYNMDKVDMPGHTICSLTYDNQGYVYSGWTTTTIEQFNLSATKKITYEKRLRKACKLFPRDWKTELHAVEGSAGFCLPEKNCHGLLALDEKDLCYDFSKKKDEKILIYVRDEDTQSKELQLQSLASTKPETLNYSSLSVRRLSNKFHQLEDKTIEELLEIVISNQISNQKELLYLLDNLDKYTYLFYILCKRHLKKDIDENEKKAILIAIIELYLKENNLFTIKGLEDKSEIVKEILATILEDIDVSNYSILLNSLLNFNKSPYEFSKDEYYDLKFLQNIFCIELLKAFFYNYYFFENLELYKDVFILNELKKLMKLNSQEYLAEIGLEEKSTYKIPYHLYQNLLPFIKTRKLNPQIVMGLSLDFLKTLMEGKFLKAKRYGGDCSKKRQLKSYK